MKVGLLNIRLMSISEKNTSQLCYGGDDYESDFEFDGKVKSDSKKHDPLFVKPTAKCVPKPNKQEFVEECSRVQGQACRSYFLSLDAYSRHKALINHYVLCYPGATSKLKREVGNYKTDSDIIKENHCFLWEDEVADTWGKKLAKKYYDKLFKEYCITDLSFYKENKIAMRWRTEKEVVNGKGQFSCGNLSCDKHNELRSWEVNFGYVEHGEKKNALVKVRLCPDCSYKLNYRHKKKEIIYQKNVSSEENPSKKPRKDNDAVGSSSKQPAYLLGESTDAESANIWKKPVIENVETSKDDEFEKYLADLLL